MKTKIKRHSRAVISVILALSMLVSCMMVGIIATDAAYDNSEGVGYYYDDGTYYMKGSFNNWGELSGTKNSNNKRQHYYYIYTNGSADNDDITFKFKEEDGDGNKSWFGAGDTKSISTTGKQIYEDGGENIHLNRKNLGTTDTTWYKVKVWFEHSDNCYCWYEIDPTNTKTALTPTLSTSADTYCVGDTVSLSTTTTNNFGTVTYSYKYKKSDAADFTDVTGNSFTAPNSPGEYIIQVTANDGDVVLGTNSETARTATATKTITVKQRAATGVSLTATPNIVGSGVSTDVTLTAAATPSAGASLLYTFYKGDTPLGAAQSSNTFVAPAQTLTEDTTYKVVVSDSTAGTQYGNAEATATVSLAHDVYIYGDQFGGWDWVVANPSATIKKMTYDPTTDAYYYDADITAETNKFCFWDDTDNDTHYRPSSSTKVTIEDESHTSVSTKGYSKTSTLYTENLTGNIRFWFSLANKEAWITYPYDPANENLYSLSGNVTDKYIVDSEIVKPKGISTNEWWATYHPEMAIDDGSGGTYKITFTTTDYASINIGFAGKDGKQYGFVTSNGTEYITNGKDYTVPDAGVSADALYVKESVSGGSLKLKPNTTYTITVQQTGYEDPEHVSGDVGMVTIDTTTVYANAYAMVEEFDINTRRYKDPVESTDGGTATVSIEGGTGSGTTTASKTKPANMVFTASNPNADYEFAGWYTDPECTDQITSTNYISGANGEILTENGVTVTHNRYALFKESKPTTEYNVTLNITDGEYGSVTPVSGLLVTDSTHYKAYAGATAVLSAAALESATAVNKFESASASGNCTFTNNNGRLTLENITGDVTVNITFTSSDHYNVSLVVEGKGTLVAQAYKSDKTTAHGSAVTVTSTTAEGNTGTIEVPVGGYVTLTSTETDSTNFPFSTFKVDSGKYKAIIDQKVDVSPFTFRPTDDLTAKAVFSKGATSGDYYLDFTDSTPNLYLTRLDNSIVSDFNDDASKTVYSATITLNSGNHDFIIKDSSKEYKFSQNNEKITANNEKHYPAKDNSSKTNYARFEISAKTTYTVYVMVNPSNSNELIFMIKNGSGESDAPSTDGYHKLYAMDGIVTSTAGLGETEIILGSGLLESNYEDVMGNILPYSVDRSSYREYYFNPNDDLLFRVQTTVNNSGEGQANAAIGVRGFVYNGKSVAAIADGNGVYHADIAVHAHEVVDIDGKDDVLHNGNYPILEVVPVYYNTEIDANDYIKFYVDANTIDNQFGFNLGYYAWYGASNNHTELDYSYPGQPLMKEGTKYVGYLPKTYVENDGDVPSTTYNFNGVTLTNLAENDGNIHRDVCRSWNCSDANYQTFDYEDPAVINTIEGIDTIEFVAKFKETSTGHQSGTHYVSYYSKNNSLIDFSDTTATMPSGIEAPAGSSRLSGFELLRNFDNKPVDIYGNVITENFSNSVFAVSVGNQSVGGTNKWDTVWMIYNGGTGTHTFIDSGNPASFIGVADDSQVDTLKGKTVYVKYESFLDGNAKESNSGNRIDGRWLYSTKNTATDAYIRVATVNKNGDTLKFLPLNQGASNARIAYYDNSVDGITQGGVSTEQADGYSRKTHFENRETKAKAVINQISGYKVVGFYMQKMGAEADALDNDFSTSWLDYDEMTTESLTVAPFTNQRENRIVVIVEPVAKSNLHITHEMYGGDGAHHGAGQFYFKADVLNPSGAVVASTEKFIDGTVGYEFEYLNSLVQYVDNPNASTHYKIRVTLRTVMIGTNTLYQWYYKDNTTGNYAEINTTASFGKGGTQETVLTLDVNDVLYGNKNTDTFSNTNLDYYSDIDMAGSLYISHQKLSSATGDGKFYAKVAKVKGGVETTVTDWTESKITVPSSLTKRDSGNTIKIYVKTEPDEYSNYVNTYSDSAGNTSVFPEGATPTENGTCVAEINVTDLYKNVGTDEAPVFTFDTDKSNYDYYTDLSKNTLKYTIQYNYNSAEYGMQSYTVTDTFTNTEMATYVQAKSYTVDDETDDNRTGDFYEMKSDKKAEFAGIKSPYEKNVHLNFTWLFNSAQYKYYMGNNEISIVVDSTNGNLPTHNATFKFPFEVSTVTNDGLVCKTDTIAGEDRIIDTGDKPVSDSQQYTKQLKVSAPHGHVYTLSKGTDANPVYITAPSVIYESDAADAAKEYFKYWSIKKTASDTGSEVEIARCYFVGFNYSLYEDYIVKPVYGDTPSGSADQEITKYNNSTTISFVENGRNQWNSLGGTSAHNNGVILGEKWPYGDRIFSNFVIAFGRKDNKMIKSSPELEVRTGVIFDRVTEVKMDEQTGLAVNNPAEYGITDDGKTNIESYISGGFNAEDVPEGGEYLNTTINNSKIDNKNRIELTKAFPNISHSTGKNTGRKNYLYRAYSYMIEKDGSYVISNPVYFTFYDIASIANGSTQS